MTSRDINDNWIVILGSFNLRNYTLLGRPPPHLHKRLPRQSPRQKIVYPDWKTKTSFFGPSVRDQNKFLLSNRVMCIMYEIFFLSHFLLLYKISWYKTKILTAKTLQFSSCNLQFVLWVFNVYISQDISQDTSYFLPSTTPPGRVSLLHLTHSYSEIGTT